MISAKWLKLSRLNMDYDCPVCSLFCRYMWWLMAKQKNLPFEYHEPRHWIFLNVILKSLCVWTEIPTLPKFCSCQLPQWNSNHHLFCFSATCTWPTTTLSIFLNFQLVTCRCYVVQALSLSLSPLSLCACLCVCVCLCMYVCVMTSWVSHHPLL